ncbi:hypothetical protein AB4142_38005, partial [Variovorax sp. 2RAF20]
SLTHRSRFFATFHVPYVWMSTAAESSASWAHAGKKFHTCIDVYLMVWEIPKLWRQGSRTIEYQLTSYGRCTAKSGIA